MVVLGGGELQKSLKNRFENDQLIRFAENAHVVLAGGPPVSALRIWVGTCSQSNLLGAAENEAIMLGYFDNSTPSQIYNCQKLQLLEVGFPSPSGLGNSRLPQLVEHLQQANEQGSSEGLTKLRRNVRFYADVLAQAALD